MGIMTLKTLLFTDPTNHLALVPMPHAQRAHTGAPELAATKELKVSTFNNLDETIGLVEN
jgi:hypothetical protein